MIQIAIIILISYIVGSIPTSIVVSKLIFKKDVREYGSGNAGGTNAWRVFGWQTGVFVMLMDIAKGFVATFFIARIAVPLNMPFEAVQLIAGSAAVMGHIWTIFANFNGGKGVGTAAGMLLGLYPMAVLICFGVFGLVLITTGYVSASSLSAALALPIVLWLMDISGWNPVHPVLFYFSIPIVILIFFTHRSNLKRLIKGTENRFEKVRIFTSSKES